MSLRSFKPAGAAAFAALSALGMGAAGLAWTGAQQQARTEIARLIEGRPGLSVAATAVDLLDGSVTLRGIAVDGGAARVRIGALTLRRGEGGVFSTAASSLIPAALAFPASGGVDKGAGGGGGGGSAGGAPGVAVAENVVMEYQGVTYTIPRIEVAGTTLSNADLAAMLDTGSGESVESRVRRLNAASITIPEIKADTAKDGNEQHWDQQRVLFASITNGKAAIASAGSGILKTKSADGSSVAEIGGLQMTGVDMGQIVHVAAAARTGDSEAQQQLAESVVISAIKVSDAGGSPVFTLALVKEAGLKARPLAAQTRTSLLSPDEPGKASTAAFTNDIIDSFSLDLLQADDLVVSPPHPGADGAATAAKAGMGRLARITLTGMRDHRFGGIAAQNFVFDDSGNRVSLASIDLHDLTVPTVLDGTQVPSLAGAELAGLAVDTVQPDTPSQRLKLDVARAAYAVPNAKPNTVPPAGSLQIDELRYAVQPKTSPELITLGYPVLDLSTKLVTSYDAKTQELKIEDWTLSGVGMGATTLKLTLGKVSDAVASTDPEARKAALVSAVFKSIDLQVRDAGLVDRLLAYRAVQDGSSVAQERADAIGMVRKPPPGLAASAAKLQPVQDAVARFIANPKLPLHLTVTSDAGLGAADAGLVNDPDALIAQLTIVATAGE